MGVLTNCWYYLALKAERAFALQLGKDKDADEISRMMRSIERCFDTKFWTGSAYRSPGYKGETDDRSQAMAVVSGLASKDKYPALTKVLKKEYHASPYMEKYVLEALFQMGEPAFANVTPVCWIMPNTRPCSRDGASEPRASVAARSITLGAVVRLPY